jgi:hypothetical protein
VRQTAAGYRLAGPLLNGISGGGAEGIDLLPQARRVLHAQQVSLGIRAPGPLTSMPLAGGLPTVASYALILYSSGAAAAGAVLPPPVGPPPALCTAGLRKPVARGQRSRPLRQNWIGISRRPSGSSTPVRTTGGPGAWSPRGGLGAFLPALGAVLSTSPRRCKLWLWTCLFRCADVAGRVGLEAGAGSAFLHLSPPMCEEAKVCWLLVWRLDTMAADAGGSRLLTMVATLGACGSTRSRRRGCRCPTVVRLFDVVQGARLRGDSLDAHQPAEERRVAQGPLPAFGRSRIPELDVVPLTTLKC